MEKEFICENCGKVHDGTYGTGRFCSKHCASSFCAKQIKHRTGLDKIHETLKAPFGTWKCNYCDFVAETRKELNEHKRKIHFNNEKCTSWCKGQTKETNPILKRMGESFKQKVALGLIIPPQTGKPLTEEHKKAISESMKRVHVEGRAHNIGNCRWNNEPSYPEQFFIKVIENEFTDKNYKREFPFFGFSLDFAWPDKMKCIEIDGEQHERFEEYKERDKRKDKIIAEQNWKCLRISWKEMFKDTKKWIQIAKTFIDEI